MPPHSKYLWEEGMCVKSFKLVENGVFQEEGQNWLHYSKLLHLGHCIHLHIFM